MRELVPVPTARSGTSALAASSPIIIEILVAAFFILISRHSTLLFPWPLGADAGWARARGMKSVRVATNKRERILSPPPRTPEPWNRGTEVEEK